MQKAILRHKIKINSDNLHLPLQRAAQAPDRVSVVCNAARGIFLTQRGAVLMSNGQTVSPTEFERFAGKAASKKWKASIRIDKVRELVIHLLEAIAMSQMPVKFLAAIMNSKIWPGHAQ